MPVTLEQSGTPNEIRLDRAIDIPCTTELNALLFQALKCGSMVRVWI